MVFPYVTFGVVDWIVLFFLCCIVESHFGALGSWKLGNKAGVVLTTIYIAVIAVK